jgi:hypothetical protein
MRLPEGQRETRVRSADLVEFLEDLHALLMILHHKGFMRDIERGCVGAERVAYVRMWHLCKRVWHQHEVLVQFVVDPEEACVRLTHDCHP